jgi:hypothetical protein
MSGWINGNTKRSLECFTAYSIAKDYYSMRLHLLTNATVVDEAIRFVAEINYSKP